MLQGLQTHQFFAVRRRMRWDGCKSLASPVEAARLTSKQPVRQKPVRCMMQGQGAQRPAPNAPKGNRLSAQVRNHAAKAEADMEIELGL